MAAGLEVVVMLRNALRRKDEEKREESRVTEAILAIVRREEALQVMSEASFAMTNAFGS